jgi:glutamate racemase
VKVISKPCQVLVQLAEEGWINNGVAKSAIEEYMKDFENMNLDKLILGCTHFPLFNKMLQNVLNNTKIINTGESVSLAIKELLEKNNLKNNNKKAGVHEYYLTDDSDNFKSISKLLFKTAVFIKKVDFGDV